MTNQIPFIQGAEYLTSSLLQEYWERLNIFFQTKIKTYKGSVEDFLHQYAPDIHLVGRIYFHLVENRQDEEYPFAFLSTYVHGINKQGKTQHKPLKYALTEYENDQNKMLELLSTVNNACRQSSFVSRLMDSGDIFHPLSWTAKDAFKFLNEIDIYEEAGILCRIPNWWKRSSAGIRMNFTVGDKKPSLLGLDSLVDFKAGLVLGDTPLTLKEAKELLSRSEGLAYIKGKWVTIDKERLKKTLSSLEKAKKLMKQQDISLSDAMRMLMSPQTYGVLDGDQEANIDVNCGQWLESLLEKMRDPRLIKSVSPAKGFKAVLRPYQQKGLDWLFLMHSVGFGACLADDMGLGKTIQVLAFLKTLGEKNKALPPSLLILPASLLGNWAYEIKRFAPSLRFMLAHPSAGEADDLKKTNIKKIDAYDLVITTYAMARRHKWIESYRWNYIILDEAQAIKNPNTAQSRVVKKLNGLNRLVLTGTPIENHLTDLWSLFDFLNPGLLGSSKEFARLNKKLNEGNRGYSSLRKVIGPYILRRLKTDKSIISDLPDKIEVDSYAGLSKNQVVLYRQLVNKLKQALEAAEGIQRKGLVLASLMKFKQICNHPDQYLGLNTFSEHESGKFLRLREICETIFEKREKVLVFTRFKEMTEPLYLFLSSVFGKAGLILHGGTPVKKRRKLVEDFQNDEYIPYLILSVKAGGTGLNLTAANHVIHFDRWWNPAVENQATDRAFRIGQHKNIVVHKFITQGTVEEKIARMIEDKKQLSEDVIGGTGEQWITEMDNKELLNLFKMESNYL